MAHAAWTRVTLSEYTHAEPCGHVCVLMRRDLASELSSQQRTAEAAAEPDTAGATRALALRATTMTQDGGERSTTPEVLLGRWSVSLSRLGWSRPKRTDAWAVASVEGSSRAARAGQ